MHHNSPSSVQFRKAGILGGLGVLAVVVSIVPLSGCVPITGSLAKQATNFNMSAANAQDDTLLLNIVRAAYRYPMHYSLVTTLSETGTVTFGGTLTLPFAPFHNGVDQYNVAPTAQVQISPVLNTALVETKEFYNGMLAPLSLQEIALFTKEGVPPSELYTLAFGGIVIRVKNGKYDGRLFHIKNDLYPPSEDADTFCSPKINLFGEPLPSRPLVNGEQCFAEIMEVLEKQKLTIESGDKDDDSGLPAFPEAMLREAKIYDAILAHNLKASRIKMDDCVSKDANRRWVVKKKCRGWLSEKDAERLGGGEAFYRLVKETPTYGICFDRVAGAANSGNLESAECEDVRQKKTKNTPRLYEFFVPGGSPAQAATEKGKSEGKGKGKGKGKEEPVSFTFGFEPRSTEGIIYYLGEIARCYLRHDPNFKQSDLSGGDQFRGCHAVEIEVDDSNATTELLFRLNSGNTGNDEAATDRGMQSVPLPHSGSRMTVNWSGAKYWVDVDSSGRDRSASVLRILTQMVALNQSEKSLPAPSVVPVLVH
jgi:hypothetical protein